MCRFGFMLIVTDAWPLRKLTENSISLSDDKCNTKREHTLYDMRTLYYFVTALTSSSSSSLFIHEIVS